MNTAPTNQGESQTPVATPGATHQPSRRNGRGGNQSKKNNRFGSSFKGATEGMNGHVFQTYAEQSKRGQFQRTLEELQVYCSTTYKQEADLLEPLFNKLENPKLDKPTKPVFSEDDDVKTVEEDIYKEEIKAYVRGKINLEATLRSLFNVVWGQCSITLKSKLESKEKFKKIKEDKDIAELLKQIKGVVHQFESHTSIYEALDEAKKNYYLYFQGPKTSNTQHVKNLQEMVDIIEYHGGSVTDDNALVEYERKLEDGLPIYEKSSNQALKQRAKDKMLGVALIRRADRGRYAKLMTDLKDQYTLKSDVYPSDITSAHNLLENYSSKSNTKRDNNTQQQTEGLQFAQRSDPVPGRNGKIFPTIECFKCNKKGHYASQCPSVEREGVQLMMSGTETEGDTLSFTFMHQQEINSPPTTSILIDTGSTISVFKNKELLKNVTKSDSSLRAHTNGGFQDSVFQGYLPGFFKVWYNPHCMVNILAWSDVRKKFRITADTSVEPAIRVHFKNGEYVKFKELKSGLYLGDIREIQKKMNVKHHNFVNLTKENKSNFTTAQVKAAERARVLFKTLGMPSYQKFIKLLESNAIKNCPVTPEDVKTALFIWGPETAVVKGKTTRIGPKHIPDAKILPLPQTIRDFHSKVTLCVDFFYVNGIPILHTISRSFKFRTVEETSDRSLRAMVNGIMKAVRLYKIRGLQVKNIHADNEFECCRDELSPIVLDIVGAGMHVGEVERSIRTIKERIRCSTHSLPFRKYPKMLTTGCINYNIKRLNNLPADDGVSNTLSPSALVTGAQSLDYNELIRLQFGDYAQVHQEKTITNNNEPRSVGAIALYPSGNGQHTWHFMSLNTGKRLHRRNWTVLPMGEEVISRVHLLAEREGRSKVINNFNFEWRPGTTINELHIKGPTEDPHSVENIMEESEDFEPLTNETEENQDLSTEQALPIKERREIHNKVAHEEESNLEEPFDSLQPTDESLTELKSIKLEETTSEEESESEHTETSHVDGEELDNDSPSSDNEDEVHSSGYNLRKREPINYSEARAYKTKATVLYQHGKVSKVNDQILKKLNEEKALEPEDMFKKCVGICMNQMSAKAGIRKHGEEAVSAILKEFGQLENMKTFKPRHKHSLTKEQIAMAMRIITIIKEKRCGDLKGRSCVDGRPQRAYISKEEAASPTTALESLLITLLIDAWERRDVATADVVGAYLNAYMRDFVIVKLVGDEVDIICKLNPEYKKYVVYENGKKTLYLQLIKALYGCIKSALLWYECFTNCLSNMGFKLNDYDKCVANKIIGGN